MDFSKILAGLVAIVFSVVNLIPGDELVLGPLGAYLVVNGIAEEEVVSE